MGKERRAGVVCDVICDLICVFIHLHSLNFIHSGTVAPSVHENYFSGGGGMAIGRGKVLT